MSDHIHVCCRVTHPFKSASDISNCLGLPTWLAQTVGESVVTPKGRSIESKYVVTRWVYRKCVASSNEIESEVEFLADHLFINRKIVHGFLDEGGDCLVFVNLFSNVASAFMLNSVVLEKLGSSRVRFGVEVFS